MKATRASVMTPQERLTAAFNHQPCDSVPFTPLVEGYFQFSLPGGREKSIADLQYEMSGHVLIRAAVLRVNTPLWLGARVHNLAEGIEEEYRADNGDILHTVRTPVGSLTWRLRFAPETPYIPWVIENRIRSVEDVKTYQYLVEHTDFEVWLDYFKEQEQYVGDKGLVTIIGPISPLQQMINLDMGLERVIYMLADYPDEMNEMLETFHARQLEAWKVMAELPGEICFIHDNLSSTTTSRAMYRRYDRRYVNEYADVLDKAGKKLITHWCGRLTAFIEDFAEARHHGISDITPLPTGDLDIVEARRTWGNRFVMMGGIDPTLFARGTPAEVEAYVEDLLERMGPARRGFILGSGDAVPFGTPPENVRAAAAAASRFTVD